MDRKDIMALRDLALSDRHCEFGSHDILNLVEAFVQQEAVASQARAAALEEAAKVVEESSAPYVLHTSTGAMMFRSCTEKLAAAIRALIEVKA